MFSEHLGEFDAGKVGALRRLVGGAARQLELSLFYQGWGSYFIDLQICLSGSGKEQS